MPDPSTRFVPGPRNLQIKHWLHRVLRLTENEKLRFSRPIWLRTILSLRNNQGILLPYHAGAIFMHLSDAFIQSDLQCIQAIHIFSVCVFPGNRTHKLCAANAMLYH